MRFYRYNNRIKIDLSRSFCLDISTPDSSTARRTLIFYPFGRWNFRGSIKIMKWKAGQMKRFEKFLGKFLVYSEY